MARTLDQAKRSAILKAARTVFLKDGYSSAKMSDIASEAGVAPGTLYLYFDSKEALAGAIGEDFYHRLSSRLGIVVRKLESPDGIADFLDWAIKIAVQERDVLRLRNECIPDTNPPPEARRKYIGQLGAVLKDLMASGAIRHYDDANILADMVSAVVRRVLMSYTVVEDGDSEQLRATAIAILKHTLFDDATLAANCPVQTEATASVSLRRHRRN